MTWDGKDMNYDGDFNDYHHVQVPSMTIYELLTSDGQYHNQIGANRQDAVNRWKKQHNGRVVRTRSQLYLPGDN